MLKQDQKRRALILITTLTITPVFAQTVPTDEPQQTQTQSTPLTETQGIELDPITITGERVERGVEDTASSVTVITDEVLPSLAGPDRVDTVLSLTPNVQQFGNNNSGPTIRGQDTTGVLSGADAFLGGSRPRTTIQIDGRPISFNEFIYGFSSIWDVERIEVFNGPQTTTQGANSIAGAIFVETKDPTFDFESSARAIIAEENTRQLSGVISGPLLGDELAGRLAIDYRTHESFLDLPNATQDIGEPRDEEQYLIARAKLLYEPTNLPGLSTQLTLSLNDVTRPQTEIVSADPMQGIEFNDRINTNPAFPVWRTDSDTVIADIDYDFFNDWSISNTLTYAQLDIERLTLPGEGVADIDGEEFTNETLLRYASTETNLSGFIGTYFRQSDNDEFIGLNAFVGTGEFEDTNTSVALFGELTWAITPQLDLTLGGRYQRDNQDRDGTLGPLTVDYDETFTAFLPKLSLAYGISDTLTIGATVVKGFNPGGTTVSFDTGEEDFFAEETLWNYEFFVRSSWLDNTLQLNANVFYTDFNDPQRITNTLVEGNIVSTIDNAEEARSYGAELALNYEPSDRWSLFASLGLLETELKKFSLSSDPVEGNEFAKAPNLTSALGVRYEIYDNVEFSAQGRYTSDYFSDDLNSSELEVDDYFVADAQLAYTYKNLRMFAFVTNLFDEFYVTENFGSLAYVGDPQEFGAGIEIDF